MGSGSCKERIEWVARSRVVAALGKVTEIATCGSHPTSTIILLIIISIIPIMFSLLIAKCI